MPPEFNEVAPRHAGVFRIARRPGDAFAPTDWKWADKEDGTFGGRFDDPSLEDGRGENERFRIIYCGTNLECAFTETLQHLRAPVDMIAKLEAATDDDQVAAEESIGVAYDPDFPAHRLVDVAWRENRQVGHTHLDSTLRFANISHSDSLDHLRQVMASDIHALGLDDVDLSVITSRQRKLTQRCARYIYDQVDEHGAPRYAGIRYVSIFGVNLECWAVFDDRIVHNGSFVRPIDADDRDLAMVARNKEMTIEVIPGRSWLRPWRE